MTDTPNFGFNRPEKGTTDWNVPLNDNFTGIDAALPIVDSYNNRTAYSGTDGQPYLAHDIGQWLRYDAASSSWVAVDRSGTPSHPTDVTVGRLNNATGDAGAQVAWDGLVVPVAPGLGPEDAIDPAETDTPIADARDAIKANADGGKILLPPAERITEAATLTGLSRIEILGSRARPPLIEFTDLSSDAIRVDGIDDGTGVYIDGVVIDGSDWKNRTGGSAIHFTGSVPFFNLGRVTVRNWIDPVIHMDTGHPFESDWYQIYGARYEGRLLFVEDAGEPLEIQTLVPGPESPATSVHFAYPGGDVHINKLAHRANKFADRAIFAEVSATDIVRVGLADFETSASNVSEAVRIDGQGRITIDECRLVGRFSLENVYRLNYEPAEISLAKPAISAETSVNNIVKVDDDTKDYVRYDGPASDITNSSGASPLSYEIECRGPNFTG
jgi:hypothetical protein